MDTLSTGSTISAIKPKWNHNAEVLIFIFVTRDMKVESRAKN